MKKILLISIISVLLINGCTTVNETIYLQDIKISGPVNHPPLHITQGQKRKSVTISPRFSFNSINSLSGKLEGHTQVNDRGFYQVDTSFIDNKTWEYKESNANRYDFKGENLKWNIPDGSFGFDIDFAISDKVALFGGLNYVVQNQRDLLGGCAGLGYFGEQENYSTRFDMGVTWQNMYYDASTVIVTSIYDDNILRNSYVTFYRDRDKSSSINFFGSFTYNTAFDDFPLNFYLNASYFSQTLFDFEPGETNTEYYPFGYKREVVDARGEAKAAFISISPGIYQNIGNMGRVIFGIKMMKETQLENSSESFLILPVVQFDLSL